jgi:hypothetical protein
MLQAILMLMQDSVISSDKEDFDCFIVGRSGNMNLNFEYTPFLNGYCGISLLTLVKNLISFTY